MKRFVLGLGILAACGDNLRNNGGGGDASVVDGHKVDGMVDARPDARVDAMHDAFVVDAMPDGPNGSGAFGSPAVVVVTPGVGVDDDPSMTSDLLELYFNRDADIYVAKRTTVGSAFGVPVKIAELSSAANETGPSVSANGLVMYFASDRSPTLGNNDIWMSTRASRNVAWGVPVHVTELSSPNGDTGIAVTNDNLKAVFASDRASTSGDLFLSTRSSTSVAWGAPVLLSSVHQPSSPSSPMLSDDGLSLTWDINLGSGGDFYIATRATTADSFGTPVLLTDLSSPTAEDNDLWISPDGHHCVFISTRVGGVYSFFEATR